MKRILLQLIIALWCAVVNAQVRFTVVDPANSLITIQNFGTSAVNVQQYRLCALFEYASLSGINVSLINGDFNLAPGLTLTIEWLASSGFNPTESDLGLYLPTGSYSDPMTMVDFMQYGTSGQGRENVAQQAGLWQAGSFLTGTGPWFYTGDGTQNTIVYWQGVVPGCMNGAACNYNPDATLEDSSCIFPGESCDDGNADTFNDALNNDCVCVGSVAGCINEAACNFDPQATIDNGLCEFPGNPCDDGNMATINDVLTADCMCQGEGTSDIYGCMNMEACNYNPDATIEDGSCEIPGSPCDDGNELTVFDVLSLDCNCEGQLVGCTDPGACNFSGASVDDGSCLFPGDMCDDNDSTTENDMYNSDCICEGTPAMVMGCTFDVACNYNPDANSDDGSCLFPGDACDDNNPSTINDIYNNACECAGTPTSIEESGQFFNSFPNPSNSVVRIESAQGRIIERITVRDLQGRVVIQQPVWSNYVTLDVQQLASGRYVASIRTIDATYSTPLDVLHFQ